MTKRAAILRWTGRGNATDLRSSVQHVLKERGVRARVSSVGGSLVLTGPEPVGACSIFENMPGIAWTAAGYTVGGPGEVAKVSAALAANYLRRGYRFSVKAEASGRGRSSDLAGAVTSAMLEEVKGARAVNEGAKVRFRAALDGEKGAVGVEVAVGPGGSPMGDEKVVCLVSGGVHSSVLAWNAVLLGFRVKLVHAPTGEESTMAAARLYAELSNRADPRGLSLTLAEGGGSAAGRLSKVVAKCKEQVFGGFTAGRPAPALLGSKVLSPLYMMPEESFESQFAALGLKSDDRLTDWGAEAAGTPGLRTFGGKTADVSGVLDGLA
ncbi:MAG: hypothetical protein JRN57_01195 [Nitrososphaerota archaeon]|nr:hypothetical protein [Nitrososphaerota archaeon]MDG7010710.1 hypothetical protein [Nitrososphaerota archaeon]